MSFISRMLIALTKRLWEHPLMQCLVLQAASRTGITNQNLRPSLFVSGYPKEYKVTCFL